MGIIISRFKKKSSAEQLEKIYEEIKDLEECCVDKELRQQEIMKNLKVYIFLFLAVFSSLLYFNVPQNRLLLIELSLFSLILYYILRILAKRYYTKKIKNCHTRLKNLKIEKKRLIDEIMDRETYKVAREILEKYAPEINLDKNLKNNLGSSVAVIERRELVKKNVPPVGTVRSNPMINQIKKPNEESLFSLKQQPHQRLVALPSDKKIQKVVPLNPRGGLVERFFEYLIGDGPNNRYALICSNCSTHNGLALQEEFEYTTFKCYACFLINPAKKQRPIAPKLDFEPDSCPSSDSTEQGLVIEEIEEDTVKEDDLEKESYLTQDKEPDQVGRTSFDGSQHSRGNDTDEEKDLSGKNPFNISESESESESLSANVNGEEQHLSERNPLKTSKSK